MTVPLCPRQKKITDQQRPAGEQTYTLEKTFDAARVDFFALLVQIEQDFYVGYAPSGWDQVYQFLKQAKAPIEVSAELGLVRPSQKDTTKYFDLFRDRVMFPIIDLRGKVIGFGGRQSPQLKEGPKYLNSTDSLLFQKSKVLYGLYQAQKHIREQDSVIVVEGYFDVCALHAAGFKNTVATCGTALTVDHLRLLQKFTKKIIILFDGDDAGVSATLRSMELGLQHGITLYGAQLPLEKDPDEILISTDAGQEGKVREAGVEAIQQILSRAEPILDTQIKVWIERSQKSGEDKTQAIKALAKFLSIYQDPIGKEVRIQEIVRALQIPRQLLVPQQSGSRSTSHSTSHSASYAAPYSTPPVSSPSTVPAVKPQRVVPLGRRDRILLRAFCMSQKGEAVILECENQLPKVSDSLREEVVTKHLTSVQIDFKIEDIFMHEGAKLLVQMIKNSGNSALFRNNPSQLMSQVNDLAIQQFLREIWVENPKNSTNSGQKDSDVSLEVSDEELKVACLRSIGGLWARFSQQLKKQLNQQEVKEDAHLHQIFLKEFIDVKRKLEEFKTLYDETEFT
jgi:DNA primase